MSPRDSEIATRVFGEEGGSYVPLIERLVEELPAVRYSFMPNADYQSLLAVDLAKGMQVYWRELLYRAHWAAGASIIRTHLWVSGAQDAFAARNLLILAASLRGLLESAADTNDALNPVAPTIARDHSIFDTAIAGRLSKIVLNRDLEERLIHFTHARKAKPGEVADQTMRAKTAAEYLQRLGREVPEARTYYGHLCDLVHAGALSVASFCKATENEVWIAPDRATEVVSDLCHASAMVMPVALALGVGTCILILKTLNRLSLDEVHTAYADSIDLDQMPAWIKIQQLLNVPTPHPALDGTG